MSFRKTAIVRPNRPLLLFAGLAPLRQHPPQAPIGDATSSRRLDAPVPRLEGVRARWTGWTTRFSRARKARNCRRRHSCPWTDGSERRLHRLVRCGRFMRDQPDPRREHRHRQLVGRHIRQGGQDGASHGVAADPAANAVDSVQEPHRRGPSIDLRPADDSGGPQPRAGTSRAARQTTDAGR
jgi:hypothetical protein